MPATNNVTTDLSHPVVAPVVHRPMSPPPRVAQPIRRVSSAPELHARPVVTASSSSLDDSAPFAPPSSSRFPISLRSFLRDPNSNAPLAPLAPIHRVEQAGTTRSAIEPLQTTEPTQRHSPNLESATRTLEEVHHVMMDIQRRNRRRGTRGVWIAILAFFGHGPDGRLPRRLAVDLMARLAFGLSQMATIITLLVVAARTKSPVNRSVNEWRACPRPLGELCAIWCVRVVLEGVMAIWGYRREKKRNAGNQRIRRIRDDPVPPPPPPIRTDANATQGTASFRRRSAARTGAASRPRVTPRTFALLKTLLSTFSLTWFVVVHPILYTSVNSCRLSAPHLWWLTLGILCIGYLIIVEVILVAFVVFILGPLIFLILNLVLICMGRHPLRPGSQINPEIRKMSQNAVDLIPLVLYIPAPVPKERKSGVGSTQREEEQGPDAPLTVPEPVHSHSYPPQRTSPPPPAPDAAENSTSQRPRRRFTFRRIKHKSSSKSEKEKGKDKLRPGQDEGLLYDDKWERGDYPFVRLEGNRAACAICLSDFREPRRVRYSIDSRPGAATAGDVDEEEKGVTESPERTGERSGDDDEDVALRLADVGEGAQPLRLLACAHVFHKSCLDPWLTQVSGRCPVCQRPVEVEDEGQDGRRR